MTVYFGFLISMIVGSVFSDDGSCVTEPSCPKNEHHTQNNTKCIRTCANREESTCDDCKSFTGCVCDDDLVRFNIDGTGKCVHESQCHCNGDHYAVSTQFPSHCQPTCDNINPQTCTTTDVQLPPGCVCIKGYVKAKNGKCIKPENCPEGCNGDAKARFSDCPSLCPLTCEEPLPKPCVAICAPAGCVCNYGYFLTKDGRCVELDDCPGGCGGDSKATFRNCPSLCPLTCEESLPRPCVDMCAPAGCVCKDGYVLSPSRQCIDPKTCPALDKK